MAENANEGEPTERRELAVIWRGRTTLGVQTELQWTLDRQISKLAVCQKAQFKVNLGEKGQCPLGHGAR